MLKILKIYIYILSRKIKNIQYMTTINFFKVKSNFIIDEFRDIVNEFPPNILNINKKIN